MTDEVIDMALKYAKEHIKKGEEEIWDSFSHKGKTYFFNLTTDYYNGDLCYEVHVSEGYMSKGAGYQPHIAFHTHRFPYKEQHNEL
tara:strand:+ start:169 stop:426 length:258 start_codon:yes stop_codon:yes gene_type:complete